MNDTTRIKKQADMERSPLPNCHEGVGVLDWTVVLDRSETEGRRLQFFHDDILPAGASVGVHSHASDEEYYYVVSGTGVMTLDGRRHEVGPGDITAVYPGGSHGLENPGPEPLRFIVVSVA